MKAAIASILLVVCAICAAHLQAPPKMRGADASAVVHAVPPPSPQADLMVALLGGFRSIVAEVVWFRADRLQDSGRYAELAQLAAWLTFLEPHTPEVWSYAAWNLAYNISVMMTSAADRWRWVEAGLKLLRDDGLRLNPRSATIRREISWFFLAKIGGNLDDASPYYRKVWKGMVEAAKASGDWSSLRLDKARMDEVDACYGAQDWTSPLASALYWAHEGLALASSGEDRRELRHQIVQALMVEAVTDSKIAPRALAEMQSTYAEFPSRMLEDMISRFRERFRL